MRPECPEDPLISSPETEAESGRLKSALEASADGLMIVDHEGRVRFANPQAQAMLGRPGDEILARPLDYPIAAGQRIEVEFTRPDGAPGVAEMRVDVIPWGERPALLACLRDVTERAVAEKRLLENQSRIKALSSQLSRADHRERRRIAGGLHDDVAQILVGIKLQQEILARRLGPELAPAFALLNELTLKAIRATRSLVFDLIPPSLFEAGFGTALADLVDEMSARFGLLVQLAVEPACERLETDVASLAYQAIHEALMNVIKHAHTNTARVTCAAGGGRFTAEIVDSGVGMDDPGASDGGNPSTHPGVGSFNLRERFEQAGGGFEIVSSPGRGTTVRMWLPLEV